MVAHTVARPNTAVIDEAIAALRALTEHRDDLLRTRTRTVNRLHALLTDPVRASWTAHSADSGALPLARPRRPTSVHPRLPAQADVKASTSTAPFALRSTVT
ncbi:transposase [Actinoplanes sp. NPDC051633]|uniref:IS110 family transposase n=1 Tax=Actinoplanes sp. NPDC051633 TaxID=3155670 RepID=UPI003432CB2E